MAYVPGIDWVTGTSFTLPSEIKTSILKSLENRVQSHGSWEIENKWGEPHYYPGLLTPGSLQSAVQGVNAGGAQQTPWFEKTEPSVQGDQWDWSSQLERWTRERNNCEDEALMAKDYFFLLRSETRHGYPLSFLSIQHYTERSDQWITEKKVIFIERKKKNCLLIGKWSSM